MDRTGATSPLHILHILHQITKTTQTATQPAVALDLCIHPHQDQDQDIKATHTPQIISPNIKPTQTIALISLIQHLNILRPLFTNQIIKVAARVAVAFVQSMLHNTKSSLNDTMTHITRTISQDIRLVELVAMIQFHYTHHLHDIKAIIKIIQDITPMTMIQRLFTAQQTTTTTIL